MRVIGLTGPARAGKDTVAGIILDAVPGAVRQGFADKLKVSAARSLGWDGDEASCIAFCDWLKTEGRVSHYEPARPVPEGGIGGAISGRQFLQRYGTEAHRDVFGEDFWLDAVLPEGRDDAPLLVIPDVRFENEARRVLDVGGEVWRIERPDVKAVEAHVSEAGIPRPLISRTLVNDGTLEHLKRKVRIALLLEEDAAILDRLAS